MEYYRQAKENNDEDMKVVAISKASELQENLADKITIQDFKALFGDWDAKNTSRDRRAAGTRGAKTFQ
jgi:hypothetical protein